MPIRDIQLENLVANKGVKDPKTINVAIQHGHDIQTTKKNTADGPNRHGLTPVKDPKKLDNETEDFSLNHLSKNFTQALQQARTQKGMSQHDLAIATNEKANTIALYESGKIIPSPSVVNKLSKVLQTKLNLHM